MHFLAFQSDLSWLEPHNDDSCFKMSISCVSVEASKFDLLYKDVNIMSVTKLTSRSTSKIAQMTFKMF